MIYSLREHGCYNAVLSFFSFFFFFGYSNDPIFNRHVTKLHTNVSAMIPRQLEKEFETGAFSDNILQRLKVGRIKEHSEKFRWYSCGASHLSGNHFFVVRDILN